MTVQELQFFTDSGRRWTEACPVEHGVAGHHAGVAAPAVRRRADSRSRRRPVTPVSGRRIVSAGAPQRSRPSSASGVSVSRSNTVAPVAPGRRANPSSTSSVRACQVEAPSPVGVVDDVPTWALLTCGLLFGMAMLLALAFLGGPAYA